jgi:hypothetical protein
VGSAGKSSITKDDGLRLLGWSFVLALLLEHLIIIKWVMITSAPGALVKEAKIESFTLKITFLYFKSVDYINIKITFFYLVSLTSAPEALVSIFLIKIKKCTYLMERCQRLIGV